MPQTRPRGLTGSVTTGRTADPHSHTHNLSLSHTHTHTHTTRARSAVWVVGAISSSKAGGREPW